MAQNVRFYSGTKQQYLGLTSYNPMALYFCTDTGELYRGDQCISDGIRIVPTHADLPKLSQAADGIVYLVHDSRNGYMLSPDRTEWVQTIYAPATDAYIVPEDEIYNTVTTVGAVRDVEAKIYQRIEELSAGGATANLIPIDGSIVIKDNKINVGISSEPGNALTKMADGLYVGTSTSGNYAAGLGLQLVDGTFSVKLADTTHGLVAVDGALALNLATKDSDGAMSKEDKAFIDAIPDIYMAYRYEVSSKPKGTIVDYRDKEIRIMCPSDTKWKPQNSGAGADANLYYIGFKAYAPDGAASFKEDLAEIITDNTMYYFNDNSFAGIDEHSRKFSIVWLPVAKNTDGVWTYYGVNSNKTKYIGWYYSVEWFDESGMIIGTDTIRINLSNENCHNNIKSFYGAENDVTTEVTELQETIAEMQENYSWSDMA